jgi:hypothetical protein
VPNNAVLIDGYIQDYEWHNAKEVIDNSAINLSYKVDENYTYLLVKSSKKKPWYIDAFIEIAGQTYNFHVSTQLGQRLLLDTAWTDSSPSTKWGYTNAWYANEIRFDRSKMKELSTIKDYTNKIYTQTVFIPMMELSYNLIEKYMLETLGS